MKKKLLIFLASTALTIFVFLAYAGLFEKVTIEEREMGPYTVLVKPQRGSYKQTPQTMKEVVEAVKAAGLTSYKGFGLYYDSPKKVDEENLRAEVGVVLPEEEISKVQNLATQFQLKNIPAQNSVVVKFPYRIDLSILLGIFKVYPLLTKYVEDKGYNPPYGLEVYNKGQEIFYIMPMQTVLNNQ